MSGGSFLRKLSEYERRLIIDKNKRLFCDNPCCKRWINMEIGFNEPSFVESVFTGGDLIEPVSAIEYKIPEFFEIAYIYENSRSKVMSLYVCDLCENKAFINHALKYQFNIENHYIKESNEQYFKDSIKYDFMHEVHKEFDKPRFRQTVELDLGKRINPINVAINPYLNPSDDNDTMIAKRHKIRSRNRHILDMFEYYHNRYRQNVNPITNDVIVFSDILI